MKLRRTIKAQRRKKGKKKEKKEKKKEKKKDPDLGHEQDFHHLGSGSFDEKLRRS